MKAKRCLNCGKVLRKRQGEPPHEFAKRRFCSRKCVSAWRRKQTEKKAEELNKRCLWCGKPLKLKEKENMTKFRRRKFCSQSCLSKYTSFKKSKCRKKRFKDVTKAKIEKCLRTCFEGAKVWVNGRLVMDDGWKDEKWWERKIEKTKEELKRGKVLSGV